MVSSLLDRHAKTGTSECPFQKSSDQGASRQEQISTLQIKVPIQADLRVVERIQKTDMIQRYYLLRVYTHASQLVLRGYHTPKRFCQGPIGAHRTQPTTLVRGCRSEQAQKAALQ